MHLCELWSREVLSARSLLLPVALPLLAVLEMKACNLSFAACASCLDEHKLFVDAGQDNMISCLIQGHRKQNLSQMWQVNCKSIHKMARHQTEMQNCQRSLGAGRQPRVWIGMCAESAVCTVLPSCP